MQYTVAHLDEIDELGSRTPYRPVRHRFGITSFGVNSWTGHEAGDRIINEHDEQGGDEELYLVHRGRATFELDGERVDAPAGTFVFVPSRSGGPRSPRSRGRRSSRSAARPAGPTSRSDGSSGRRSSRSTRRGSTPRPPTAGVT